MRSPHYQSLSVAPGLRDFSHQHSGARRRRSFLTIKTNTSQTHTYPKPTLSHHFVLRDPRCRITFSSRYDPATVPHRSPDRSITHDLGEIHILPLATPPTSTLTTLQPSHENTKKLDEPLTTILHSPETLHLQTLLQRDNFHNPTSAP